MSCIFGMFPGQGSQKVGMGKELLDEFPYTARIFEEVEDTLKVGVRKLCLEGPETDLTLTANTQPCLLTVSTATWYVLKEEAGIQPAVYAGHSLGEYSALVAAEKLTLTDAARLVRKRGEAMQESVPVGVGSMLAVLRATETDLENYCVGASSKDSFVQIANYNSPDQMVVAGHADAVDRLAKSLTEKKLRSIKLPVSAPFHSKLMVKAQDVMEKELEQIKIIDNDNLVIANLTGEIAKPYATDHLVQQISSPVRWTRTLETASQSGVDTYLEIGAGKVLCGLAKKTLGRETKTIATDSVKEALSELV